MRLHVTAITLCFSIVTILVVIIFIVWPTIGVGGVDGVSATSHRSNTQQLLPDHHYLADMDGDGVDEWIVTNVCFILLLINC
jgi:hypothetical protein